MRVSNELLQVLTDHAREMLPLRLAAGAAFQLVGALEEVGCGLDVNRIDLVRLLRGWRQVENEIARYDLETVTLLAHGDHFSVEWYVVALGASASFICSSFSKSR